jgi:hypothetical protein
MSMPGFTAEDSLYRTSGRYYTASAHNPINGSVYPAQSNRSGCTTYTLTLRECCSQDPLVPECWTCTTYDENGFVVSSYTSCPPCQPATNCNWDAQGCWTCTSIDEACHESTSSECPAPKPTRPGGGAPSPKPDFKSTFPDLDTLFIPPPLKLKAPESERRLRR